MYCVKYFEDILKHTLPQVKAVVEKRQRIAQALKKIGLKAMAGSSTFYFFVSLGDYPGTSMDFGLELLRRHAIAVVPGSAYGRSTERFIRVGIGAETDERIVAALRAIKSLIDETKSSGAVFSSEEDLDVAP